MGAQQSDSISSSVNNADGESYCGIVVIAPKNGDDCLTQLVHLPQRVRILSTGRDIDEIRKDMVGQQFSEATVIFNVCGNASTLAPVIREMPNLVWIHSITAGVDHLLCPEIINNPKIRLTNAKGVYSSTLAEYAMASISYFAKHIPRLLQQKSLHQWEKFSMHEIKGSTMGIVGYGDIGASCAKLAKAYGMNVLALRRRPELSIGDPLIDKVFGMDELNALMCHSDYLIITAPLTKDTHQMINEFALAHAKKGQILINLGRGQLIDESALVAALKCGTLGGAALDVFAVEPLPKSSELWDLPNVLISPHNADQTDDFRHKSVKFFCENCRLFLAGEDLLCEVNKTFGY